VSEVIPRIAPDRKIELTFGGSSPILNADPSLLACSVATVAENAPAVGALVVEADIPVTAWEVGPARTFGKLALCITLPSGIQLTFSMPPNGAAEMGRALVARGEQPAQSGVQQGTVH
jgi:hypothetical protein